MSVAEKEAAGMLSQRVEDMGSERQTGSSTMSSEDLYQRAKRTLERNVSKQGLTKREGDSDKQLWANAR